MKAKYISYEETAFFSTLVVDYIHQKDALKSFFEFSPDMQGMAEALAKHQFLGNREILVETLTAQYAAIKTHPSVAYHIKALGEENTYTVTTGHQLNLFTGPLYFIYKIVSTINLALELSIQFPDKKFVPIYWMATEDHDFEEINHVRVEDKPISWIEQSNGATGRLSTQNVRAAVEAYTAYLGVSANGKKLAKVVQEAYLQHQNLADATRYLVNALFEQYGLVIINADDARLKTLFAPMMLQDITHAYSAENIHKSSEALEAKGYKTQVNGREINFFYLKEEMRKRIILEDGLYQVQDTEISFTVDSLKQEMQMHPERFSPNVVMRPLYQEVILPNIAYIGGGAEVAYWLQLKKNFDFYHVPYPVILLRNSALVIDRRSAKNLHNLGFKVEDIFGPIEKLKKNWVLRNSENELCLSDEKLALESLFNRIKLQAFKVDKSLAQSTEAANIRATKLLDNLEKKLIRAEKRKHGYALQQLEQVKNRLFPNESLQERYTNLAPMYVNYGDDFIASLIENFQPLGGDFTLLLP